MSIVIVALSIIAAVSSMGALAFSAIVRKSVLARAREQAQDERLDDLEKRLENQSHTLGRLWKKAHPLVVPTPKEKKDATVDTGAGILGMIHESPATAIDLAIKAMSDEMCRIPTGRTLRPKPYIEPTVGLYSEKDARTEIIVNPPIKRHRPNNKNYRGHGKGTNARLKLTEEQMLAMMEMSDKGMTGHQIADVFGVSRTTVQRVLAGTFQTGKQRGKA